MKRSLFFLAVFFTILFSSCEKEEYTEPVSIGFEFSMDALQMSEGAKAGSFTIDKGTLVLQTLEFDGRRDQGDDYYFTSGFATPLMAELHTKIANQKVEYDIPQGIYNRIELNFSMGVESENAICFEGRFQRGPMDEVPVIFEYPFQEQIKVRAKNNLGSDQIVISKDNPLKAKIIMNVPNMFQFVNMSMIRNAQTTQQNGGQTIKITNTQNTEIFNLVASRLDNAIYVVFE